MRTQTHAESCLCVFSSYNFLDGHHHNSDNSYIMWYFIVYDGDTIDILWGIRATEVQRLFENEWKAYGWRRTMKIHCDHCRRACRYHIGAYVTHSSVDDSHGQWPMGRWMWKENRYYICSILDTDKREMRSKFTVVAVIICDLLYGAAFTSTQRTCQFSYCEVIHCPCGMINSGADLCGQLCTAGCNRFDHF